MSNKGTIKTGGGGNILSPIYSEMGGLARKPRGIARPKPFRHEKQRTYSSSRKGR